MYVRINKKARKPVNSNWARIERYKDFKNAFSLMEMMVVLLIVAILAAATAPMVTKKMTRNAGTGDSPWVFTGLNNDIAYNLNGASSTAIIGATSYRAGTGPAHPRLVLANGDANQPALVFATSNGSYSGQIVWDSTKVSMNNAKMGNQSVAFGMGQTIGETYPGVTAIGHGVIATGNQATAVGYLAKATTQSAVAIGNQAKAETGTAAIAIGETANATGFSSIAIGAGDINASGSSSIAIGRDARAVEQSGTLAIGTGAQATAINSLAIGTNARALHAGSVAIGVGAETDCPNQIRLGGEYDTVVIPGHLIVDKGVVLGARADSSQTLIRLSNHAAAGLGSSGGGVRMTTNCDTGVPHNKYYVSSDRRLKNVGEAYTAGLGELKKLNFFHYTFKKDEAKTPHVGVMAQEMQKVFPDAVTKGEDGYLRIRMEDMFYAVINAVKELDTKIAEIVENVTSLSKKVDEQQQVIDAQQKLIEELQAQNAEFEKRLTKIEKKAK